MHYPDAKTSLYYQNPYQLFVATVLSAQTTDQQVNKITAGLFQAVPTIKDLAALEPQELEPYLKGCGLYRNKSRYLVAASRIIVSQFGGKVPDNFDQLIKLPGVGRKTANVIISSAFGKPALAVDTHVFRVSRRLGLANGNNVVIVEEQLKALIPVFEWTAIHHRLIRHGRTICQARKPDCQSCFLEMLCFYAQERRDSRCPGKS
jgi:endonuclease III